ncbi:MAG TPA: hypothetical protein VM143_08810 [Acidimicrobiales bacterium]|nr:hypothetical protein [Acidimicrobiales bacterium]
MTTSDFPRVRNRRRTWAIVSAAVMALVTTAVLVAFVVRFASRRPDDVHLGDKNFVVGRADRFAERIEAQGAPILFKDPLTSKPGRELYVQHLGDDEKTGWLAIEAYAPGQRRLKCILRWDRGANEFVDPCTKQRFPADGAGLTTYRGDVDDRTAVVIDLRTRATD